MADRKLWWAFTLGAVPVSACTTTLLSGGECSPAPDDSTGTVQKTTCISGGVPSVPDAAAVQSAHAIDAGSSTAGDAAAHQVESESSP